jgi:protocatechuate 3,4-dioxygenase beta subunit
MQMKDAEMPESEIEPRRLHSLVSDTPEAYVREPEGAHPPLHHPPYKSTALRHPKQAFVYLPHTITEITGPALQAALDVSPNDADLTAQHDGDPIGERIIVFGRVFDTEGKPLRDTLVEVWQANAAGRYRHRSDNWPAPLDPNFSGAGRCVTDDDGRYRFTTIRPGPYPWGNHHNAWRPAHIHFSLLGRAFAQRLVTQMYFPGDPLLHYDPIFNSVAAPGARERMVSRFSIHDTIPNWAHAYEWDIYLRGPAATVLEEAR